MKILLVGSLAVAGLIVGGPTKAADLPEKAPPPPVMVPQFNWTGFYLGGNLGGGWTNANITDTMTSLGFGTGTHSSFLGGGQVGYNYQFGSNVVIGGEWFIDGITNNNNNALVVSSPLFAFRASANAKWVSTVTGRLGFTGPGWDRWLIYGKGGGGWVGYNVQTTDLSTGLSAGSFNTTQTGWVGGGGIEWAFAPNWTAKLEYQYLGLSMHSFVADRFTVNNASVQTLTLGVNYLFNWAPAAPIAASY
jgi:outer membrane immunogenic protein